MEQDAKTADGFYQLGRTNAPQLRSSKRPDAARTEAFVENREATIKVRAFINRMKNEKLLTILSESVTGDGCVWRLAYNDPDIADKIREIGIPYAVACSITKDRIPATGSFKSSMVVQIGTSQEKAAEVVDAARNWCLLLSFFVFLGCFLLLVGLAGYAFGSGRSLIPDAGPSE